jgi:hypothetical protein
VERALAGRKLKSLHVEPKGGLLGVAAAWAELGEGKVSGKRLVIHPDE